MYSIAGHTHIHTYKPDAFGPCAQKMLENDVWSTDEWKLKVAQMRKSVPTQCEIRQS